MKPCPRSGHSACLYKDMMLIFGGMHEVTKELDDMYLFDFRNKRWILFFDEIQSPLKLRGSQHSPDGSPASKFSQARGVRDSFKQQRPLTQGAGRLAA